MLHDVTASRTAHAPRASGGGRHFGQRTRVRVCCRCRRVGGLRGELSAQRLKVLSVGWAEEAIVTHLDEALGQDMLKETVNESFGGQRAALGLAGIGFVTKRDLVILDLDDATVAEGDTKDVGSEILERGAAIADGLAMHDPVLFPYRGGDVRKTIGLAQRVAELGAKEFGKRLDREQEILAGRQPRVSVLG